MMFVPTLRKNNHIRESYLAKHVSVSAILKKYNRTLIVLN